MKLLYTKSFSRHCDQGEKKRETGKRRMEEGRNKIKTRSVPSQN